MLKQKNIQISKNKKKRLSICNYCIINFFFSVKNNNNEIIKIY